MRKKIKVILKIITIFIAFTFGMMIFEYVAEPESEIVSAENELLPSISAKEAILIDGRSGKILYEKNADKKGYPASTTKIMTAILTLDICKEQKISLDEKITIPKEAEGVEGSSLYIKSGEKYTIRELLYGVMLRSGNDGATALASCIGGNIPHFIERMNEKARELGCSNTHFTNPTGLYEEDHYTTAKDLASIARYAMKNKEFRKIAGTKEWKNYTNKNKTVFQYEGGTGIKIGFTKKSGRTLVASSMREGTELICVVLNDGDWFEDAYRLMDYGYKIKGVD